MKPFLLIIALLTALPGMSQLRKVEWYFKKGDYERCLTQCQQAKPGKDKEEYTQIKLYQCQSYIYLFKKTPAKISYLDQALQVHRTEKFTTTAPKAGVTSLLLSTLSNTVDSLHKVNNKNLAKKYVKIQASQFKDTSELFAVYYPPVTKTTTVAVVKKEDKKERESILRIPRTDLVKYAEQFLNIPYKWAGEDSSGFDCSGLVWKVYRKFGYTMAHGSRDQSELGEQVTRAQLKPGDLVFFGKRYDTGRCKIDHVAIVYEVTDTKLTVIHSTSKGVNIQEMKAEEYWGKKILFYRNLIDHFTVPNTNRL